MANVEIDRVPTPLIRPPNNDDWPGVAALLHECLGHEAKVGGFPDTPESLAAHHAAVGWSRVMVLGNEVIGFVSLDRASAANSATKLAVTERFRHKKYGRRLMEAAEAAARGFGWKRLCVAVVGKNQRLFTWYVEKLGYSIDSRYLSAELTRRDGFPPVRVTILCKNL